MILKIPNSKLYQTGLKVTKLLNASNFQAFWVGGVVRNILLKRESDNIDIATDAKPDEIEMILQKARIYAKPVGKQFGSILAIVNGCKIEITTFRAEGGYSDKRHPDKVTYIREYIRDAKRRDFTVNALYFHPISKQIFDPTGYGIKDLRLQLLRFVGNPKKRIDEDALRMLRGVRLATEFSFRLEKNSFAAIKTRAKYILDISSERVKTEFDKILISKNRVIGLKLLDSLGLLKFIIPEMSLLKTFFHKSKQYHLEGSMFDHTALALDLAKNADLELIYALLFHDIGKPLAAQKVFKNNEWVFSTRGHADISAEIFLKFVKRLRFSATFAKDIEWLIRNHMTQTSFAEMRPEKQVKLVTNPNFENLIRHWKYDEQATLRVEKFDLHNKRYRKSKKLALALLEKYITSQKKIKRLADGDSIMKKYHLKPGPMVGKIKNKIIREIIMENNT